ncbi:MAG: DapH/DapD/GlmU-related protein [Gemmatimonadaceae bacterium]
MSELPPPFVHESSYVDDGAVIGAGTKVWHFCHIMPGAVIGERCNLGQNVVVMPGTRLGNNVKVQNNVSIYEGVELEDDVFCGPSMVFTNVMNPRSHVSRKHDYRRTLVRRGASIGANATVVCGTTLGETRLLELAPWSHAMCLPMRWSSACRRRRSGGRVDVGSDCRSPTCRMERPVAARAGSSIASSTGSWSRIRRNSHECQFPDRVDRLRANQPQPL